MMKKFISILCLLVLSIQILPVRQVGSLLSSNQITEELPHSFGVEKAVDLKFETVGNDYLSGHIMVSLLSKNHHIDFASSIPDNHNGDIQTPPPNFM